VSAVTPRATEALRRAELRDGPEAGSRTAAIYAKETREKLRAPKR